jgi:hypothetical protein
MLDLAAQKQKGGHRGGHLNDNHEITDTAEKEDQGRNAALP